ncbi:MAG: NADH-quinone oxidoreductase subunit NuoN [Candidatus Aminicenantes bacterium]|nr:NADH-quinone oxidoreductase subunit NuoN [Candidatus Aminicenantes bacterium]
MNSLFALLPLVIIVIASLLVLLLEVFLKKENKNYLGFISLFFLIVCAILYFRFWNEEFSYFKGSLVLDKLSLFFFFIFAVAVSFVILLSMKYISLQDANHGEFYALLLFALSGMMIMVSSSSLVIIFLGLEVLSISSYALAGLKRKDKKSSEAAIKYFLLGSFASGFFVYGLALLYGASHSTDISGILDYFRSSPELSLMATIGLGLVIIGFGFKIAVVPFHMWTPDVYEGAPTPITAFFSIGPKAVGFAVLLRIFLYYWRITPESQAIFWLLWIISVLTMLVGNLIALRQTNLKRILAYSSIAHAGYLMVAILARDGSSLLFYLAAYLFMNLGAFAAVIALSKKGKEYLELDDYAGVGFKYPWIGATFTIFLLSLAGFPPTAGFLAKFYVFSAAVREGLVPLVIIGVLASLISVFYYLRIVVYMYMREPSREIAIHLENPALFLVIFLCLYGVLQLGIFPGNILLIIREAINALPF